MAGQIKCFPGKVKLKQFIITKPLYEMLKGLMYEKEDDQRYGGKGTGSRSIIGRHKIDRERSKMI